MTAFVSAGAGFLLAVLWFDLMFDVQALRPRRGELPEAVLASMAGYYGRVTTAARPMNGLVSAAMLATLVAIALQIARGPEPRWVGLASLALAGAPILLAGLHIVPNARRLGARQGDLARQSELARSICREHLACFAAVLCLLLLQLGVAGGVLPS
jgi:hypothetical protein